MLLHALGDETHEEEEQDEGEEQGAESGEEGTPHDLSMLFVFGGFATGAVWRELTVPHALLSVFLPSKK